MTSSAPIIAAIAVTRIAHAPQAVKHWRETRSAYWRIRDATLFPSLKDKHLIMMDGEYAELPAAIAVTRIAHAPQAVKH